MKHQKELFVKIAKEYASKGISVLPVCLVTEGQSPYCSNKCAKPGKHPLTPHGYKDATTDLAVIEGWGAKYPYANLGILTGITAGIAVLDIDRKNGGVETFNQLIQKHGSLPLTPCVLTGGGGFHFYFQVSKPTHSITGLFEGIDLKADGGYVVGPPSGHESGESYEWKVTFNEAKPALMPNWLVAAVELYKKNPAPTMATKGDRIDEGGRNDHLTSVAGTMRRGGMSEPAILAALLEENSSRCNPPLPEEEVANIAKSIQRYPSGDPTHHGSQKGKADGQAAKMVELGLRYAKPFHSLERDAFISILREGHWENHAVRSTFFKSWLLETFHQEYQSIPGSEAVGNALNLIEAKARLGVELPVFTRVAAVEDRVYIDLCNNRWQAIEVSPSGWHVVDDVPVKFRRSKDMGALPIPARRGGISELRPFLNCGSDDNWVLVVSWLVCALRGKGPFPILALLGSQGTAKSTTAGMLKSLTDPAVTAPLRSLPRDERDLAVSVRNSYLLSFTNISRISEGMSDALCRVATGEGLGTRALYTNDEEALFGGFRPICLNGIQDFIEKGDLLDRTLLVYAPVIQEKDRRDVAELWQEFEAARPFILGGLLDAVALGLRRIGDVKVKHLPRMADFAKFIIAAEPALPWVEGEFMKTYSSIRQTAAEVAFEASVVAQSVVSWLAKQHGEWEGTATELLAHLGGEVSETTAKSKSWPHLPKSLSDRLRRDAPALSHMGIEVTFRKSKDKASRRLIILRKIECDGQEASGAADASDEADAALHLLSVQEEEENN